MGIMLLKLFSFVSVLYTSVYYRVHGLYTADKGCLISVSLIDGRDSWELFSLGDHFEKKQPRPICSTGPYGTVVKILNKHGGKKPVNGW